MKKVKKSLLTIVVLSVFAFSCIALGFNKNTLISVSPAKSKTIMIAGYVIDPPPIYQIARPNRM